MLGAVVLLVQGAGLFGETGYEAWLRYETLPKESISRYADLPSSVFVANDSIILQSAALELRRGLQQMLGRQIEITNSLPERPAIVLGTFETAKRLLPASTETPELSSDGFWLKSVQRNGHASLLVIGANERATLYGVFAFLRQIAIGDLVDNLDSKQNPYASIRFLNHWDNLSGTIERGYAGKSIFWENDHATDDLLRVRDYGRLMASVGVNGCSINNVNADARVITPEFLAQIVRIADALRPWGVRVLLSIDFSSPRKIGGLDTFDPLDPAVVEFWNKKVDEVYKFIPDLAGLILKADSEGRLGPSAYGRTHADAANVIARALKPHGALLFYRGFVYDHHMDWRDPKLDRAKAAYDNFRPLDGQFDDNVVVQIKHGPIDFQVREPASPLFGGLEKTSQAIELQITQEYTGQQRHLCYLAPMWKQVLDFDLQAHGQGTPVKALAAGKTFKRPTGGFVGVSNVGRDTNWLGHELALANLYGFGRLAWDPQLSEQKIAEEWARLTFGNDERVVKVVVDLELRSWPAYENYTGPLGAGTLTDIIGVHYGPAVESSERNGWGQWHRADERGLGMDRAVTTGTGFIGQYAPAVAATFESDETCPDELLLFMHHVPYTYRLHSGKTVIQHIYDSHYTGADAAAGFVEQWKTLKGRIDEDRYSAALKRLKYQAGHAVVWRDAINQWFFNKSGIADKQGRVGHFPNRFEAESMELSGYAVFDVRPWETASGGKAIRISNPDGQGRARLRHSGEPGNHDLIVQYFDQNNGRCSFRILVAGREVDHWLAEDSLPGSRPDGHTSTRRTVPAVSLNTGDEISIEAAAQGGEQACLDYLEVAPSAEQ
jgi:alpha-glucuronidase